MKIDELIEKLTKIKEEHGNIEVALYDECVSKIDGVIVGYCKYGDYGIDQENYHQDDKQNNKIAVIYDDD